MSATELICMQEEEQQVASSLLSFVNDEIQHEPWALEPTPTINKFCRYIPKSWQKIAQKWKLNSMFHDIVEPFIESGAYMGVTPHFFSILNNDQIDIHRNPGTLAYVYGQGGSEFGGIVLTSKYPSLAETGSIRELATIINRFHKPFKRAYGRIAHGVKLDIEAALRDELTLIYKGIQVKVTFQEEK